MGSSLFRVVTQLMLVIVCWLFGTALRSHFQWSRSPRKNTNQTLRNNSGEWRPHLHRDGSLISLSSSYVGICSLYRSLVFIINKKTLKLILCDLLLPIVPLVVRTISRRYLTSVHLFRSVLWGTVATKSLKQYFKYWCLYFFKWWKGWEISFIPWCL